MKLLFRICLINVLLPFLFAFLPGESYRINLVLYTFVIGMMDLVAGLIFLSFKKHEWAQGFFLSTGILLLIGFVVCSNVGL